MRALVLHMDDGASHISFVETDTFDLTAWVEECYDGLQLLGVVRVELRDKFNTSSMRVYSERSRDGNGR